MKFTTETLIQIYLDGSFTEEAQAEFDKLMRHDPVFAEKVTQAVAERVGPAPEAALAQAETRLDAKIETVWLENKPAPFHPFLKKASALLLAGIALGLMVLGYEHLGDRLLGGAKGTSWVGEKVPQAVQASGPASKTLRLAKVDEGEGPAPALGHALGRSDGYAEGSGQRIPSKMDKGPAVMIAQANRSMPSLGKNEPIPSSGVQSRPAGEDPFSKVSAPSRAGATQEGFPLRLEIETEQEQAVVVTVLDPNGLPVRGLYQGTWNAGVHWVDWDGMDNSGNPLPPGSYTVVLNAGGKLQSGVVTIQPIR